MPLFKYNNTTTKDCFSQDFSYDGDVVHGAGAPFHDHVGELGHLDLRVLALLHKVHDGQWGALGRRAPPLAVAIVALRLPAAPSAPEGLVASRLNDPVLGPGEGAEVNEVLLPAAGVLVLVTVASRTDGGGNRRGLEHINYLSRGKAALIIQYVLNTRQLSWFYIIKRESLQRRKIDKK